MNTLRYILSLTLLMSAMYMDAMESRVVRKAKDGSNAGTGQYQDDDCYVIIPPTRARSEAGSDSDDDFVIAGMPKKKEHVSRGVNTDASSESIAIEFKPRRMNWVVLATALGQMDRVNHMQTSLR